MKGETLSNPNDRTSIETRSKNVSNTSFNQITQLKKKDSKDECKGNLKRNKVATSEIVTFQCEEANEDLSLEGGQNVLTLLASEKEWHTHKALTRKEMFESILHNQAAELSLPKFVLYLAAIVFASSSFCIPFCLFPAHDLVKYPEYWYEIIYHLSNFAFFDFAFWTFVAGSLMNLRYLQRIKTLAIVCTLGVGTMILYIISTYYTWTKVLSYNYPIPFFGYNVSFVGRIFCCIAIYLMIPVALRSQQDVQDRMKHYIYFVLATMTIVSIYQLLMFALRIFKGQFQPLIALTLPVNREMWIWILKKMFKNNTYGDERGAMTILIYLTLTNHTICLCYIIGSITDDVTSWVLMASDFLLNIYLCLKIVWDRKRNPIAIENQIDLLQDLSISELVELQAPLSFTLLFALAYYTPIGGLIGNVSNGYWAYEAIDNINDTLANMIILFLVDFVSTLASVLILWYSCKINLLMLFTELQREFYGGFILILGYMTMAVNIKRQ